MTNANQIKMMVFAQEMMVILEDPTAYQELAQIMKIENVKDRDKALQEFCKKYGLEYGQVKKLVDNCLKPDGNPSW